MNDLKIVCPCGRIELTIKDGKVALRNPELVKELLLTSTILCCGCGGIEAENLGEKDEN